LALYSVLNTLLPFAIAASDAYFSFLIVIDFFLLSHNINVRKKSQIHVVSYTPSNYNGLLLFHYTDACVLASTIVPAALTMKE
jgi:hypothetical protein